jgi:hypothetical protein
MNSDYIKSGELRRTNNTDMGPGDIEILMG